MPKRIQMTRRPGGWRKDHPDAVIVARPSKWGNPYTIQRGRTAGRFDIIGPDSSHVATVTGGGVEHAREVAVDLFRLKAAPTLDVTELAGRDLACWCPLSQPCHADVLLELANGGGHRERAAGGAVVKGEVLRELRVRIDGRERVVRVRRRIAPTGPRCPEWWHGWCQHPLGHAGPHKWGDR